MDKAVVIAHFGGVTKTAMALGISKSAVSQWADQIPAIRAVQVEYLSGGALQADRACLFRETGKGCVHPPVVPSSSASL